jgi:metal-sulfur cluster biosynthetic enzyme
MPSRDEILDALKNVEDPELGIDIVSLGLVYEVDALDDAIDVRFTLTFPGCPAEEIIQKDIVETLRDAFGISRVKATTVWTPRWKPSLMSEEARVALGYPV